LIRCSYHLYCCFNQVVLLIKLINDLVIDNFSSLFFLFKECNHVV